jgi:hypothetical protein
MYNEEEIENKKTLKANKDKEFILKCILCPEVLLLTKKVVLLNKEINEHS